MLLTLLKKVENEDIFCVLLLRETSWSEACPTQQRIPWSSRDGLWEAEMF